MSFYITSPTQSDQIVLMMIPTVFVLMMYCKRFNAFILNASMVVSIKNLISNGFPLRSFQILPASISFMFILEPYCWITMTIQCFYNFHAILAFTNRKTRAFYIIARIIDTPGSIKKKYDQVLVTHRCFCNPDCRNSANNPHLSHREYQISAKLTDIKTTNPNIENIAYVFILSDKINLIGNNTDADYEGLDR